MKIVDVDKILVVVMKMNGKTLQHTGGWQSFLIQRLVEFIE